MSSVARRFYEDLADDLRRAMRKVMPYRATVTAGVAGKITIQRIGAASADVESYARLAGFDLAVDDEVIVLELDGKPIVLGKLIRSTPSSYELSTSLTAKSFNSPHIESYAASGADTSSTTNTATYVNGAVLSFSLPAGTWTLYVLGGAQMKHSASGRSHMRVVIDSNVSGERFLTLSSTAFYTVVDDNQETGCSGSTTIELEYKSFDSGTTSCQNPWLFVVAVRTS